MFSFECLKFGTVRQFYATIFANLITVSYGAFIGWSSPSIPILESENTPLPSGPLTAEESSWITSIIYAGGFIITILSGYTIEKFGRKASLLFLGVPSIVGWLLIEFGTNPIYLIISRLLSGIAGGLFHSLPIFISEISDVKIRGALGSILVFTYNTGTLLGYTFGSFFDYKTVPWTFIPILIIFMITMSVLPDTPFFYMKVNQETKAKNSLQFYRNVPNEDRKIELQMELESARDNISKKQRTDSFFQDFKSKSALKALMIAIYLMILRNFCGPLGMLNYTATIFGQSGSSLPPNISSIIVAFVQILGSFSSILLVERAGRKLLFMISFFGCAVGLAVLGLYTYLNALGVEFFMDENLKWIPLVSFSFVIYISNCGYMTIIFLYIAELAPQNVKAKISSICLTISWVLTFALVKNMSAMMLGLGLHGTVFFFGITSIIGGVTTILFLPETKGKTFDEITRSLEN